MNGLIATADIASRHSTGSMGSSNQPLTNTETRPPEVIANPIQTIPIWSSHVQAAPLQGISGVFNPAILRPTNREPVTEIISNQPEGYSAVTVRDSGATVDDWWELPTFKSLRALEKLLKQPSATVVSTVGREEERPEFWLITAHTRNYPRPSWRSEIKSANSREEIIAVLRLFGLNSIADRLRYLRTLANDDADEPPIEIESLRAMALFLMSERQLPDPQIGVTQDGLAQIEWRIPTDGILAMVFLSSGLIRFAAMCKSTQHSGERLNVHGTFSKDHALAALKPFTSRL